MKIFFALIVLLFTTTARAQFVCKPGSGGSETPIQTVRNFFWMVFGFPGTTEYDCFTDNVTQIMDLVPKSGMIGQMTSLAQTINSAAAANLGTSITCASLPSSGSYTYGNATIQHQVPQNTIPASYPDGGTSYEKRIRYVNNTTNVVNIYEFNCSKSQMMVFTLKPLANGNQHSVLFYDNSSSTKYADFYFHDDRNFSGLLNMAVAMRVDSANSILRFWQSRSGYDPSSGNAYAAYRFSATADFTTGQATIHYHDVSNEGRTLANYTALTDINSTIVTSTIAPDGTGGSSSADMRKGCAASFSVATNNISSAADCAGLPLTQAPNTAFGDSFSMQSIQTNLLTRLQAIN